MNVPIFQESNLTPKSMEALTRSLNAEDIKGRDILYTSADEIIKKYESLVKLGFTRIIWYDRGDIAKTMKAFKEKVIPYFRKIKG